MLQNLKPEKEALCVHSNKKIDSLYRNSPFGRPQSVSLAAGSGKHPFDLIIFLCMNYMSDLYCHWKES